jgi:type IV secretion system protein VirB1
MDISSLVMQCAPTVNPTVMQALISVESSHNPFAIGVVHGRLDKQPQSLTEALAAVQNLKAQGRNFSMGVSQINKANLAKFGLDYESVFDPCKNIEAGSKILTACYVRAKPVSTTDYDALGKALSCYYSGNFLTGFKTDFQGQLPYVVKVMNRLGAPVPQKKMIVPLPIMPPQPIQAVQPDASNPSAVLDVDASPVMLKLASDSPMQAAAKPAQSWDKFNDF